MADRNLHVEAIENKLSFGDYGLRILGAAETSTAGEYFHAIYATEAAQVDATNECDGGDGTITDLALPAGGIIYGNFTDITCDSGTVIAYLREL